MRSLIWASLLALVAGCGTPTAMCGPSNCTGCCMSDGTCQAGNQNVACGTQGKLCDVCAFSDRCEFGACFRVQQTGGGGGATGGGGGDMGGGTGGGSAGGGGGSTGGGGGSTGGGGGSTGGGGGSTGGGGGSTGGGGGATGGGGGATGGGGGGSTGGGGGSIGGGGGSIGGGGGSLGGGGGSLGGGGGTTGGGGGSTDAGTGQLWIRGALDGGSSPAMISRQLPPGTPAANFSTFPRRTNALAVSSDGTLVAIGYDSSSDELVLKPAAGGTEVLIHTGPASSQISGPGFSPDKTQIAFFEGNTSSTGLDLFVMPAMSGGTVRRASPMHTATNLLNANDFAFSPDSRYLAVSGDFTTNQAFELHVFDLQTGLSTAVINSTLAGTSGVKEFGWTNTGQLLVRAGLNGNQPRLHLCSLSGTCAPLPGPFPTGSFTAGSLAVSPDGTFAIYGSNERGTGAFDFYRIASTGGTPMRIAADAPANWNVLSDSVVISPNGQWVAAQSTTAMGPGVYVFATAGGNAMNPLYVPTGTVSVFSLTFSPSSTMLAFRADITVDGSYDLYRFADLTTPNQTPILMQSTAGGSVTELRWTP